MFLLLTSCDKDVLQPMRGTDILMVQVHRVNTNTNQFRISFEARQRYGCAAELAYRFTNGKVSNLFLQIDGIANTGPNCELEPVPEGQVFVALSSANRYTFELTTRRKTDRYILIRDGQSWQIQKELDQMVSFLSVSSTL